MSRPVPPRMDETLAAEYNSVPARNRLTAHSFTQYYITYQVPGGVVLVCGRCTQIKRVTFPIQGLNFLQIMHLVLTHNREGHLASQTESDGCC